MKTTLVRSTTIVLGLGKRRILVDPMLDPARARPPVGSTASPVRNPTVELPFPLEEVLAGLDTVLVTHRHEDHFDDTAAERFLEGGLIVMGIDDVREVAARVPVVAVHMEALDPLSPRTRAARGRRPGGGDPRDSETVEV